MPLRGTADELLAALEQDKDEKAQEDRSEQAELQNGGTLDGIATPGTGRGHTTQVISANAFHEQTRRSFL